MAINLNTNNKFSQISIQDIPWLPFLDTKDGCRYPTHEKIGFLWHKLLTQIHFGASEKGKGFIDVLDSLGVDSRDKAAHKILFDLVTKVSGSDLTVVKTKEMGMFHLLDKNKQPFAVFKTGEKRAFMDLAFRQILPQELKEYAISGLFCSVKNPDLSEKGLEANSELTANLWNGSVKVILAPPEDSDYYLNGILEPFLQDDKTVKQDLLTSAKMLLGFLFFGSRDIKTDGFVGTCSIDNEEGMPPYLDVSADEVDQCIAATDLPYLVEHPHRDTRLSLNDMDVLKKMTENWSSIQVIKQLSNMRVRYPDSVAETYQPKGERSVGQRIHQECLEELNKRLGEMTGNEEDYKTLSGNYNQMNQKEIKNRMMFAGWDDGNCEIDVRNPYGSHTPALKKLSNPIEIDGINPSLAFTDNQIDTCIARIERVKEFINERVLKKKEFSLWELALGVDPVLAHHYKAKLDERSRTSSSGSDSGSLERFSPSFGFRDLSNLGRLTPVEMSRSATLFKPIPMRRSHSESSRLLEEENKD